MHRYFDRGMLVVLALLLAFTIANAGIAYHNVRALFDSRVRVGESRQVIDTLHQVSAAAAEAQSAIRGYVLTADQRELAPYTSAATASERMVQQLEALTADNAQQRARATTVRDRMREYLRDIGDTAAVRGAGNETLARERLSSARTRASLETLKREIDDMVRDESYVLEERSQASMRSMDAARAVSAFAAIMGVLMIVGLIYQMRRNIEAHDAAAEGLVEQKELFRTTLAGLGEAVVTCDTLGRITYINAAGEALTNWSSVEAVGQPIDDVVRIVDDARHLPLVSSARRALRDGVPVDSAHRGRLIARGSGPERPVEDSAAPIRDAEGRIAGAVLVFRDITDHKRSEDALKEADRRKDEFLAVLAHELRNPLAPLRNALQIVRMAGPNRGTQEHVWAMMERQIQQMVRLIDDLLDVSRITRNKLELRKGLVDIREVIDAALEMSAPVIQRYGHKVETSLPARCPVIEGDRVRLVQIVDNLLTNAAKYSEEGGRIVVAAEVQGQSLRIRVKDSGVGIPPQMLDRIFDMFIQVDRSLERTRGGLGIGLTLVKRLVELHGGAVAARSDGAGRGSEFIVTLPVAEPMAPGDFVEPEVPQTARLKIMVADDNQDSVESMSLMLELMGHEVRTAGDGERCLETCREFHPDVVLLDIGMPRLNGYDAARAIRAEAWSASTLLIAMTGWGQDEDLRRARAAGFDHHLVKPIEIPRLLKLLPRTGSELEQGARARPDAA